MFSSTTYANMFRELMSNVYVDGVITRDWCEVPIQKWHVLQVSINICVTSALIVETSRVGCGQNNLKTIIGLFIDVERQEKVLLNRAGGPLRPLIGGPHKLFCNKFFYQETSNQCNLGIIKLFLLLKWAYLEPLGFSTLIFNQDAIVSPKYFKNDNWFSTFK